MKIISNLWFQNLTNKIQENDSMYINQEGSYQN